MTVRLMPKGVDFRKATVTSGEMFLFEETQEKNIDIPIIEYVLNGGIHVDDMINYCRANYMDEEIEELESLKSSMQSLPEAV